MIPSKQLFSLANFPGWVAADNGGGGDALHDDAPRGGNRVGMHFHTTKQSCPRTYPSSVMHDNRLGQQVERRRAVVVTAGAEIRILRNADVAADCYIRDVINPNVLPNPAVVADREPPRIFDSDMRFEVNSSADFRTKQTQQSRLEATHGEPAAFKEQQTTVVPQSAQQQSATRIVLRILKRAEIAQRAFRVVSKFFVAHVLA